MQKEKGRERAKKRWVRWRSLGGRRGAKRVMVAGAVADGEGEVGRGRVVANGSGCCPLRHPPFGRRRTSLGPEKRAGGGGEAVAAAKPRSVRSRAGGCPARWAAIGKEEETAMKRSCARGATSEGMNELSHLDVDEVEMAASLL